MRNMYRPGSKQTFARELVGSNGTSAALNEQNYIFSVVKGTKIII
jgi:hypothetical protein